MKTYAELNLQAELVAKAKADWTLVVGFIQALPQPLFWQEMEGKPFAGLGWKADPHGPSWTCHALARAAKKSLPLQLPWVVVDGEYCRQWPHSWLEHVLDGRKIILDVYPVGAIAGPHLVGTAGYGAYRSWAVKDFRGRKKREAFYTYVPLEAQVAVAAYRAVIAA